VYLCPETEKLVNIYGSLIRLLAVAEHLDVFVTEPQQ